MNKRFEKLPNKEQEAVEQAYHQMNQDEFDGLMAHATHHVPTALHLPSSLISRLQTVAESAGEPEYQVMVRKWIEERLQLEHA